MGKTYAPTISLNVVEDKLDDIIEKLGGTPATVTEPSAAEFSAPGLEARLVQIADLVSEGGTGGASGLIVKVTILPAGEQSPEEGSLNKTYAEIRECVQSGIMPMFVMTAAEEGTVDYMISLPVYIADATNEDPSVVVLSVPSMGENLSYATKVFTATEDTDYPSYTLTENAPIGDGQ